MSDFHGAYMKYARTQLKFSKVAAKRSMHSPGFFCALNTLSTTDFCLLSKKKRKRLEGETDSIQLKELSLVENRKRYEAPSLPCIVYYL